MTMILPSHIPVSRDTLQQRVAVRLRELLVQGNFEPGSKLNERELCEQLGVSRTPLREAIRLLVAEGLVVLDPGRGAFTPSWSKDDISDTFDLLGVLEGLAGELAAQRITAAELAELTALQHEMQAAYERRDLPTYYQLNARAHDLLSVAARNPVLRETWKQVNGRMHALRFRSNQDEAKWTKALDEHAQILAAMKARDGATARQLLEQHLRRKRDAVLKLYPVEPTR
ncbi:GntR family transcriptional regulator [Pararhizobium sp. YC-54]|uniref:GntR family transcriptional regulator n=1 Tax=Pararhizobium sp. YC-54 TaxID=2986920 RepID=UPI0021F7E863|nr:GntR family transcriptional regulator [Pararhizobium sp. YC-54]MCW0000597.1 GntR family transcriptional regulator [Pararhizobium sp. YC-54]